MRTLSQAESVEWMRFRFPISTTFQVGTNLPQLATVGYEVITFPLPVDSGKKVTLARRLYDLFQDDSAILIYLQNWSIFPSSSHLPLLQRFRQSLGQMRAVEDSPGHLFANEREDATSMLILAAEFFWDCLVVGESGTLVCYISHDEHLDILSTDKSTLSSIQARLRELLRDKPTT